MNLNVRAAARAAPPFFALSSYLLSAHLWAGEMSTPLRFRVDEVGAATFSLPIHVPPGTAGVLPQISLTYNSRHGNGLAGVGAGIAGLPMITRCARTRAQDGNSSWGDMASAGPNMDANDGFCLDGQRLFAISGTYGASGTEYRTELANFSKIVSYASTAACKPVGAIANNNNTCDDVSPGWFKVWTKSGQVMEFGNSADSSSQTTGFQQKRVARAWGLNRVQDVKGNYFTVRYVNDAVNGDFYPQRVDYTGNSVTGVAPDHSVQFEYENRADVSQHHLGPALVRNLVRLAHIKTYTGTTLVRDYSLTYKASAQTERSELTTVTECDGAAHNANCLPPTVFSWDVQASGFTSQRWASNVGDFSKVTLLTGDPHGDGKTDLIGLGPGVNGQGLQLTVQASNGSGFSPQNWSISNGPPAGGVSAVPSLAWLAADFNGDGKTDLVNITYDGLNLRPEAYLSAYVSGSPAYFNYSNGDIVQARSNLGDSLFLVGDFRGSGRSEVIGINGDSAGKAVLSLYGIPTHRSAFSVTGGIRDLGLLAIGPFDKANSKWLVADVNGDGMMDVIAVRNDAGAATTDVYVSDGGGGFTYAVWETKSGNFGMDQKWFAADVNGDGLADLINVFNDGGNTSIDVHVNTGKGFERQRWLSAAGSYSEAQKWLVADVNGDGRADLVKVYSDQGLVSIDVQQSTGTGFAYQRWTTRAGTYWDAQNWLLADAKGLGNPHLVNVFSDRGQVSIDAYSAAAGGDRIIGITTGLGANYSIAYAPLTDASVYNRGTAAVYPQVDVQVPMYVVAALTAPDGIGGSLRTTYHYDGLLADFTGRGLLGFAHTRATQVDSTVSTDVWYRQDWPYVGMASTIQSSWPNSGESGGVLSKVSNTFDCMDFVSSSGCVVYPGRSYFPYVKQSDVHTYDLNGAPLPPTNSTVVAYDDMGNPTSIKTTTQSGNAVYSTTTTNSYLNDKTNWFIGRLTRSSVTEVAP